MPAVQYQNPFFDRIMQGVDMIVADNRRRKAIADDRAYKEKQTADSRRYGILLSALQEKDQTPESRENIRSRMLDFTTDPNTNIADIQTDQPELYPFPKELLDLYPDMKQFSGKKFLTGNDLISISRNAAKLRAEKEDEEKRRQETAIYHQQMSEAAMLRAKKASASGGSKSDPVLKNALKYIDKATALFKSGKLTKKDFTDPETGQTISYGEREAIEPADLKKYIDDVSTLIEAYNAGKATPKQIQQLRNIKPFSYYLSKKSAGQGAANELTKTLQEIANQLQ